MPEIAWLENTTRSCAYCLVKTAITLQQLLITSPSLSSVLPSAVTLWTIENNLLVDNVHLTTFGELLNAKCYSLRTRPWLVDDFILWANSMYAIISIHNFVHLHPLFFYFRHCKLSECSSFITSDFTYIPGSLRSLKRQSNSAQCYIWVS